MGAQRLAELLKHFKLPPSATQGELRRAYYGRAKLLHPDIAGEASAGDFKRLRQDYDEAGKLLTQAKTGFRSSPGASGYGTSSGSGSGPGYEAPPEEPGYDTPGGQHWKAGAFNGGFHGYTAGFKEKDVNFDPRTFRAGNQSHVRYDSKGGYSYQAAGEGGYSSSGQASSASQKVNPAQVFKRLVMLFGTFLAGDSIISRIRQDATSFQRVYT
mmetsp:Transcript_45641/g.82405  ORF Transcript_45641/g.82405 Transcript_45641/m.82405 type:complete len:213 (+) Transcript_45641:216-854(+)